jgi:hypothetical protein
MQADQAHHSGLLNGFNGLALNLWDFLCAHLLL